jgi:hypothetical protein
MEVSAVQQEYLKFVILSQMLLETNENLAFTNQYKKKLKYKLNGLNNDLEDVVRTEFNIIYNTDPETTNNILSKVYALVDKLQTKSLDELVFIDSVIDKYTENKEWFVAHGETEFLKLD